MRPGGQKRSLQGGTCIRIYAGQYYDTETGLNYNWNRYYNPATGRYISFDPIGLDGGINLFAYVSNNPANFIDPDGKFAWVIPIICAGGGCEAAAGAIAGISIGVGLAALWDAITPDDECKKEKWTCTATCHETPYGGISRNQRIIRAQGGGPTQSSACQNAIKSCQASAAPGTYTRHCQCPKCWRR